MKDKKSHPHRGPNLIQGTISINSKAIGYVGNEALIEDVEIDTAFLKSACHGDTVEIIVHPKIKGRRTKGEVVKVIKRAKTQFVGTLKIDNGIMNLVPDDRKMWRYISVSKYPKEAKIGFKVLVNILDWGSVHKNPEGEVIKVFGQKGVHDVEMESIVHEKGFETSYPEAVHKEALNISKTAFPISESEIAKRKDLRKIPVFTIDPADAKDFDDALSIVPLSNGNFEIGIHIADVSHYVRPKTALDKEASERGFSVYMVDRTIPMLPEELSNVVCSLNPDVERLTFSCICEVTPNAQVINRWFGKTIIKSAKRFTYEEAQKTLDQKSGLYFKELSDLDRLGKIMRDQKFKAGAIDFEQDEVKVELDEKGKPIRIYKKSRLDTHKLVEEFMLLANREVAEFIFKAHRNKKSAFLYRIHDVPDPEKIASLAIFVKALGYELPIKKGKVSAKDINALLLKIQGKAEESLIKTAAIRSMAKAIYSTQNIGHFGLSFAYYTHFTSPIRRYPDLLVHRMLEKELSKEQVSGGEIDFYHRIADRSTEKEISAAEAERESRKLKQVEYMQERIGMTFEGIISGVTEWGMYIEEANTRAEGMVKLRDLGDDFYILDTKNYAIVGERTKKRYTLGDRVKFKIIAADVERKTLDLVLV